MPLSVSVFPSTRMDLHPSATSSEAAFEVERALMKSALLYADQVTVLSPRVAVYSVPHLDNALLEDEAIEQIEKDLAAYRARQDGQPHARDDGDDPADEWLRVLDEIDRIPGITEDMRAIRAGFREIVRAVETGLVTIEFFGLWPLKGPARSKLPSNTPIGEIALQGAVQGVLRDLLTPGGRVPVLDATAGELLRGLVQPNAPRLPSRMAVESSLSDRLIRSVEAFPDAELDVILDVRARLSNPLIRFRAAISELATDIAEMPWSPAFDAEVDALYMHRVEPRLLEISEGLNDLGARPTLLRVASSSSTTAALGASLGLALSAATTSLSGLPELLAGAPVAALIAAIATELRERAKVVRETRHDGLYYLAELGRVLA